MPIKSSNLVKIVLALVIIGTTSLILTQRYGKEANTSSIKEEPNHGDELNDRLEVFARTYGYIRYFHPSDESADIDWDQFAIYGVHKIKQTKNNEEFLIALNELFLPIAPTIHISSQPRNDEILIEEIPSNAVLTMIKNYFNKQKKYIRDRIYSPNSDSITLFEHTFQYGDNIIKRQLGNVHISIPTILYASLGRTLGSSVESEKKFIDLKNDMDKYFSANLIDYDNPDVRLANVIISWNTFQHFYPYFDEVGIDWNGQLPLFLKEMNRLKDGERTYEVMRKMLAGLEDGHIGYLNDTKKAMLKLPISIKYIEDKLVVIGSDIEDILPGDILIKIGNDDALIQFQKLVDQTSGSRQSKEVRAAWFSVITYDKFETELTLNRKGKIIKIGVPYNPISENDYKSFHQLFEDLVELEPGILYLNSIQPFPWEDESFMNKLLNAKGIIVEMRGYPTNFHPFLQRLTERKLQSAGFNEIQMLSPDHAASNPLKNWGWTLEPIKPSIKGKVVFVTDANAISYAETIMGIVEHYKLGEIVGESTAGTNGNVVEMILPGGIGFYWTGLKTIKHDGSQHHNIGIQPTVPIKRTIKGVSEGRDEQLEAAIKIIKNGQ
ncbi:S41 family peptidase [Neobacillus sp. SCS-31]|uniref:S41 family peptidase n=1 Tax=Neobacillus oceani TaxID=3115292 RepID=UPI0039061D93